MWEDILERESLLETERVVTTPVQAADLKGLRRVIDLSGKTVAWLTLLMVLLTFSIVILRYGFNLGWIWLQ